jgi:hypothetical protein
LPTSCKSRDEGFTGFKLDLTGSKVSCGNAGLAGVDVACTYDFGMKKGLGQLPEPLIFFDSPRVTVGNGESDKFGLAVQKVVNTG